MTLSANQAEKHRLGAWVRGYLTLFLMGISGFASANPCSASLLNPEFFDRNGKKIHGQLLWDGDSVFLSAGSRNEPVFLGTREKWEDGIVIDGKSIYIGFVSLH